MATTTQRRLPKYKRVRDAFQGMIITERDREIIRVVAEHRFVHADHVVALVEGSDRQLRRRLQGLFHGSYLQRFVPPQRPRVDLDAGYQGSPKMVYGLDRKGAEELEAWRHELEAEIGDEIEPVNWDPKHNRIGESFLQHEVLVATSRTCLELGARATDGVELEEWLRTEECSAEVALPGERRRKLKPDGYCRLRAGEGSPAHLFLEADRSSEEQTVIDGKFRNYLAYLGSDYYQRTFENPDDTRVLFVVTGERSLDAGERRLRNLMQLWRTMRMNRQLRSGYRGPGMVWFCLGRDLDLTRPETMLTEAIWHVVGSDERRSLI